jgi:predicted ribonuclease YlaK
VVPDTNMFLDQEPFETIDWATLFGAQIARIIVPIVVIHELDRLKRQGNQATSRAARHALSWLKDVLPTSPGTKSRDLTPGPLTTVIEVDHAHRNSPGLLIEIPHPGLASG